MGLKNIFGVGNIVTFKTHPLLYEKYIKGDGKLVPPLMVVKEVFFEDKKKKIVDTSNGKTIGERIKYTCLFFDDNRSEFKEVTIYESMLESCKKINIARIEGKKKEKTDNYESLIIEASEYEAPIYEYGKLVYFKTKKFELFKKRTSSTKIKINEKPENKEIIQYVVSFSTPDFITCGYKEETAEDLFYPNGDPKKIIPKAFLKVKWFNSSQMKFGEQFVPIECFYDENQLKQKADNIFGNEALAGDPSKN